MTKPTVVYGLTDDDGNIFYIGKTCQKPSDRLLKHLSESRSDQFTTPKHEYIRKIVASGSKPGIITLKEFDTEEAALIAETELINLHIEMGSPITNSRKIIK